VNFDVIRHFACQILEKDGKVQQLFPDFKEAHDSIRSEVLFSILNEFVILIKLTWLIKSLIFLPKQEKVTEEMENFIMKSFIIVFFTRYY
jgi:hypothetical protein